MRNSNLPTNLKWEGNSQKMYEAILSAVPSLFRGSVKSSIISWISKNNISEVTEDLVFKAVDEIAPKNIANSKIKPALENLRTK